MHRLTQAILRERLPPAQAAATRKCVEAMLAPAIPASWARCGPRGTWTKTPWTATAGSWATITLTP